MQLLLCAIPCTRFYPYLGTFSIFPSQYFCLLEQQNSSCSNQTLSIHVKIIMMFYSACIVSFPFNPLTLMLASPWWVLAFVSLLTSLLLTKIGIICTKNSAWRQDLSNDIQIRVIGSVKPEICTKMLRNVTKKLSKIACDYTRLLHDKICPSRWCFLRIFLTGSKCSRRSITAAKI